ncbi:MAG: adenylate kinase [Clostridia bacterium]|nr:adenylate kinase [Clostridia bacterium]
MKIVLLGAPGCGKGTQASHIADRYNLPHISTGDIFREIIGSGTELGLEIKRIIDGGNLCPDHLTVEIVKQRLAKPDCRKGYILDGFPRNINQAIALEEFSSPDVVLNLHIELDKIEKRITGRRNCTKCGNSFHIDFIGNTMRCPRCGNQLMIRDDDNPASVKERLRVYASQTAPLIEYYEKLNKISTIDADKTIAGVFEQIVKVLG